MKDEYRLQMKGISKRFGGVRALSDVSLELEKGEVHALVGENGAGKSTMMKILSGVYHKDSGSIFIDGKEAKINSPKDAKELGVAVIYQEFMLAPDLTVAENIFIDRMVDYGKFINWKRLKEKAKEELIKLGFDDIDPGEKVGNLSIAYQQVVEICKCLTRKSKVLVFDEPTAVLTFTEIEKLFSIIKRLKSEGVSIIYISHRLEEIFELSDNITVFKDGTYVDTVSTSSINKDKLVSMMVGRDISQLFPSRKAEIGRQILKVENLNAGKLVKDVSFNVRSGEILGIYGLVGAGRTETMRAVFGADKIDSGKIFFFDKMVEFKYPREAIRKGLGYLPEDRKKQGLLLEQSIRMNTTLAALHKIRNKFDIINHRNEKDLCIFILRIQQRKDCYRPQLRRSYTLIS